MCSRNCLFDVCRKAMVHSIPYIMKREHQRRCTIHSMLKMYCEMSATDEVRQVGRFPYTKQMCQMVNHSVKSCEEMRDIKTSKLTRDI